MFQRFETPFGCIKRYINIDYYYYYYYYQSKHQGRNRERGLFPSMYSSRPEGAAVGN